MYRELVSYYPPKEVYVYYLGFGCGLRIFVELIGIWTRPAYCELLIKCYKPVATLWSVPTVFGFRENDDPGSSTYLFFVL
jgi:hypothetical protein